MNLRDLKYIVMVAETLHFGEAAERCCVSQPTLSGQIKKLEDGLGVAIFERTKRSVKLTQIGAEIVEYARRVIEQTDAIEQLALTNQDPLSGPLRVGAIPTLSPYLIPLVVVPLKRDYPQLQLVLTEEITDTLLERLCRHEIDIALIATPVIEPELESIPLFDEPFWLAYAPDHPLDTKKNISHHDLEKLDLLLLSDGHCLADQVMHACGWDDRSTQGEMGDLQASSMETLLQLVRAGLGCTLVPALATRGPWMSGSGITLRELSLDGTYRRISLAFRSSFPRRQAVEALADLIRKNLPDSVNII